MSPEPLSLDDDDDRSRRRKRLHDLGTVVDRLPVGTDGTPKPAKKPDDVT